MAQVGYSIDGFRRSLASDLLELKENLELILADLHSDDVERIKDSFNTLACSSNSFNCISVEGLEGFNNLSDEKEIELFE